jgi:hypothetical protein
MAACASPNTPDLHIHYAPAYRCLTDVQRVLQAIDRGYGR